MSKGGSTTSSVTIPKWQEDEIKSALEKAKGLNTPYAPYMGITTVAPDPNRDNSLNMARSAFGLPEYKSNLPEPVEMGGLRGYRAYDVYSDAMERFKETDPDLYARIVAQTAPEGTVNPVTGMPLTNGDVSATSGSIDPGSTVRPSDYDPKTTVKSVPGYEDREHQRQLHEAMAKASPDSYGRWYDSVKDPQTGLPDPYKGVGDNSGYENIFDGIFGKAKTVQSPHQDPHEYEQKQNKTIWDWFS